MASRDVLREMNDAGLRVTATKAGNGGLWRSVVSARGRTVSAGVGCSMAEAVSSARAWINSSWLRRMQDETEVSHG